MINIDLCFQLQISDEVKISPVAKDIKEAVKKGPPETLKVTPPFTQ